VNRKTVGIYAIAILLAVELRHTWGQCRFCGETSLGYFINPLLSVLLGVIILRNAAPDAVDTVRAGSPRRDLPDRCVWKAAVDRTYPGIFFYGLAKISHCRRCLG
jgi:hypothetical protein